jgi:beta-glucosidase
LAGSRTKPVGTPLDPEGFISAYLDVDPVPLFPFGYGLSYGSFEYSDLRLSHSALNIGEALTARVSLTNSGRTEAEEIVQLYTRDLVGSVTRPVKELKDFARVRLAPGESRELCFALRTDQLSFHNAAMKRVVEPGLFHLMVGGSSEDVLTAEFSLTA